MGFGPASIARLLISNPYHTRDIAADITPFGAKRSGIPVDQPEMEAVNFGKLTRHLKGFLSRIGGRVSASVTRVSSEQRHR
jgi:hypothetical protein